MKNIFISLLLSTFLISGVSLADVATEKKYPVLDVSRLENFKIELTDKQKQKIDKTVDKTNKNIEKLANKIEKTKTKISKLNASASKKKDEKLAELQDLNTQLTAYRVEIVRVTKEHKEKVVNILTQEQTDSLKEQMKTPEETK